jgi:hypothetical protein
VGEAGYPRDNIQVTVEGTTLPPISVAAGVYYTTPVTATSSDGLMTITIKDLGGDPYWVVNGIDIWTSPPGDPGAQPLRAGMVVSQGAGDTLSSTQLALVVEQAIGLWSATGLSASQVALLRSTSVVVGDLNAQGYLGLTTPERIVIDDDGVGLGWSTGRDVAAGKYDLLSTVLHEMGHVLGHDHDVADDLMHAILQPGERHLPDLDAAFAGW